MDKKPPPKGMQHARHTVPLRAYFAPIYNLHVSYHYISRLVVFQHIPKQFTRSLAS